MTETWCPQEGDKIKCIDNSYRTPDKKYPDCWPRVGEKGVVLSISNKGDGRVLIIELARKDEKDKPIREYFAVSRMPYLYWQPV